MLHDPHQSLRRENSILKEKCRQLEAQIADMRGSDITWEARRSFGLTQAEAILFLLLVKRGRATYRQVEEALYSDDAVLALDDTVKAIRAHAKRLRAKIRRCGIDFATVYSLGFEMAEGNRSRARAAMGRSA